MVEEVADLADRGVRLPLERWKTTKATTGEGDPPGVTIVLNHGLGAKDPATKGHKDDEWLRLVAENALQSGLAPVLYTARGHKGSSGWEASAAAGDLQQFTWDRLSGDMFSLARNHLALGPPSSLPFVVGGSSMGSATALYCVVNNPPQHFRGLVLIRPPTAWETRRARKRFLQGSATKCQQRNAERGDHDSLSHLVLLGAAEADLPCPHRSSSRTDGAEAEAEAEAEAYSRVKCPTLILAVEGDDAHPLETATTLNSLIADSELHVAKDLTDACQLWPSVIREWCRRRAL